MSLPTSPGTRLARSPGDTRLPWTHLAEMLSGAGLPDAADRSREIHLLLEGAMSMILIHNDPSYAGAAAEAARRLVRDAPASRQPTAAQPAPGPAALRPRDA